MIRILWLRYLAHCLRVQERDLRAELAGVEYMIERNEEQQRRVSARLTMAEIERNYRIVR